MPIRIQVRGRLPQMKDSAVIDDLSLVVTPDTIANPAGLELSHVPGHQAIQIGQGVRAGHAVLDHWCKVEDAAGTSAGKVFHVFAKICPGGLVVTPAAPFPELVQLFLTCMKWTWKNRILIVIALTDVDCSHALLLPDSLSITTPAALRPALPITPPPGWQPALHRYRPSTGV